MKPITTMVPERYPVHQAILFALARLGTKDCKECIDKLDKQIERDEKAVRLPGARDLLGETRVTAAIIKNKGAGDARRAGRRSAAPAEEAAPAPAAKGGRARRSPPSPPRPPRARRSTSSRQLRPGGAGSSAPRGPGDVTGRGQRRSGAGQGTSRADRPHDPRLARVAASGGRRGPWMCPCSSSSAVASRTSTTFTSKCSVMSASGMVGVDGDVVAAERLDRRHDGSLVGAQLQASSPVRSSLRAAGAAECCGRSPRRARRSPRPAAPSPSPRRPAAFLPAPSPARERCFPRRAGTSAARAPPSCRGRCRRRRAGCSET